MNTLPEFSEYHIHHGDCIEHMAELPDRCFDFSIFSPPFPTLYAYTDSEHDIGNSENMKGDAKVHLSFFYRQLARMVKPGRVVLVHVCNFPRMKRTGGTGQFDFRGFNIRLAERAGLIYEYDWSIRKNPQSQAIRTRSRELQFAGLESNRANSRGANPDFLIKFMVPGECETPVVGQEQVSRNDWIAWAEHHWSDIVETDTLNTAEAKGENDTRHICPLQLGVYHKAVRLYTNPGEIVFEPFAGIGSGGFVSVGGKSPKNKKAITGPRRYYGCELKDEYHAAATRNIEFAIKQRDASAHEILF